MEGGGGGRIIIFSFRGAQTVTPRALWDQSDKDYTNFPTKEKQTEKSAGNGKDEEKKKRLIMSRDLWIDGIIIDYFRAWKP